MKKFLLVLSFLALTAPAFATQCQHNCQQGPDIKITNISNTTNVTEVTNVTNNTTIEETDRNTMDYGEYLDLVLLETPSTEWGLKATHLNQSSETRFYVGGKIYLNRIIKGK